MLIPLLTKARDVLLVLLIVGTTLFFVLHLIPGSPATAMLGEFATPEQRAELNTRLGYDDPMWQQYIAWLGDLLRGDLGYSYIQDRPVSEVIAGAIGPTLVLAITATVLSVVMAVPLAVHATRRPDSFLGRAVVPGAALGLSVPGFWLALFLVLILGVNLRWFPISGYENPLVDPAAAAAYLTIPLVVILAGQVSVLTMTIRESLAGETFQPYVRTARASGYTETGIMYRHVLRNALLPAVTVVGSSFSNLLGGIVIIETVFLIPGMGWAFNAAIQSRDYSVVLGLTLVSAFIIVVVNLVVDVVYTLLDPRVRAR